MIKNYEIDSYEGEKVQYTEVMTVAQAKEDYRDYIEMGYDYNFEFMGFSGICSELSFRTEEEAIEHDFNTEDLFQYIKHLNADDKVIQRYAGKSEDDCSLVPYIPFK